jgi:hypothetical protein
LNGRYRLVGGRLSGIKVPGIRWVSSGVSPELYQRIGDIRTIAERDSTILTRKFNR